jgi:ATP/maltotriose-dependent transcriptional regulator MalT
LPVTNLRAITIVTLSEQVFPDLSLDEDRALRKRASELEGIRHPGVSLSARERMIVFLMGDGLSNKEIARQLCIAPETVKSHAKSIFWKLTVRSRAQAVYRAAALGLIAISVR